MHQKNLEMSLIQSDANHFYINIGCDKITIDYKIWNVKLWIVKIRNEGLISSEMKLMMANTWMGQTDSKEFMRSSYKDTY